MLKDPITIRSETSGLDCCDAPSMGLPLMTVQKPERRQNVFLCADKSRLVRKHYAYSKTSATVAGLFLDVIQGVGLNL